MFNTRHLSKLSGPFGCFVLCLFGLFALAPRAAAVDPKPTTLYSFCSQSNCADGQTPSAGPLVEEGGSYYGTTSQGGLYGQGAVYVLTRKPKAIAFAETVLYSFCPASGCVDGAEPQGRLVIDKDGSIFGTTVLGGANDNNTGVVFKLTPNTNKTAYTETVLYNFCSANACTDGGTVFSGLIMDQQGNLFGTTFAGGGHGAGVVFELIPNANKTAYAQSVLYNFCSAGSCTDGQQPLSGLIMDQQGNLYGTTVGGGVNDNSGVVFELSPNANKTAYTETVLYKFCSANGGTCTDGMTPGYGSLLMDKHGKLYGTARAGGSGNNGGVVFELAPNANKTQYTETVLYSFCSAALCADGWTPLSGLVMNKAGDLYGTTQAGGGSGKGTVYELKLNPIKHTYSKNVLYSFCRLGGCTDGSSPLAGLILQKQGRLAGTTQEGGTAGKGTVFLLKP
jgi:uncharacterized repeat protein (TIGR03803 family)